jgi:hypothetical protein
LEPSEYSELLLDVRERMVTVGEVELDQEIMAAMAGGDASSRSRLLTYLEHVRVSFLLQSRRGVQMTIDRLNNVIDLAGSERVIGLSIAIDERDRFVQKVEPDLIEGDRRYDVLVANLENLVAALLDDEASL